jgi:hypothetical protein
VKMKRNSCFNLENTVRFSCMMNELNMAERLFSQDATIRRRRE